MMLGLIKKEQKWEIAQIYYQQQLVYYDPQSGGINMQSPQSDLTPWTLTLEIMQKGKKKKSYFVMVVSHPMMQNIMPSDKDAF